MALVFVFFPLGEEIIFSEDTVLFASAYYKIIYLSLNILM